MERDSFVFYRSFYEAIRRQPKKVQADIYNAIADYALNGTEPTQVPDAVLSIFLLIKPQIDANNHRYTAGKKGGRPSKTKSDGKDAGEKSEEIAVESSAENKTDGFENEGKTETIGFENEGEKGDFEKPNENVNVNVNENVNENENVKKASPKKSSTTASTVVEAYHRLCPSLPAVSMISEQRKKAIRARLRSGYTLADFERAFEKAERSRFLRGANKNNWMADFDWLMRDGNLPKVLEGKYDDDSRADHGGDKQEKYSGTVL